MRLLPWLVKAALTIAVAQATSNNDSPSPSNTTVYVRTAMKDKSPVPFALQNIERDSFFKLFTALVGDMAGIMKTGRRIAASDGDKFDEAKQVWAQIRDDYEAGNQKLMVDDYHEALNKSVTATAALNHRKNAQANNSTPNWAFETFATHMILVGEIHQLSPYADMPSYILGPAQDLMRNLMDFSDVDVRVHRWETTWRGRAV